MTNNVNRFDLQYKQWRHRWIFPPVIFGALQMANVISTEEVKRAIEGSGKDFGKSSKTWVSIWHETRPLGKRE
jgi:hypothetical protein